MVELRLKLDPELRRKFKTAVAANDTTMQRELEEFVRQYVNKPARSTDTATGPAGWQQATNQR